MSINFKTEEYYKRFIELQEKLRKSEEERLKLEMKFNEMVRITREEEQMHYRKLRAQYKRFLEEDGRRQDRNERILRTLERIESRVSMLVAKTERFKLLRQQYQTFLDRIYKNNATMKVEEPLSRTEKVDEKKSCSHDTNDIVQTYLQNLSSHKLRDMLKKEKQMNVNFPATLFDHEEKYKYSSDLHTFNDREFRPNYANTIADDIMNSIYLRNIPVNDDNKGKDSREFNNNISATSAVQLDNFRQPSLKNEIISSPFGYKKDEAKNGISAADDTETDDFSESEEILYKNPVEFNKTKQNLIISSEEPKFENIANEQPPKNRIPSNMESLAEKPQNQLVSNTNDIISHTQNKLTPSDVNDYLQSTVAVVQNKDFNSISQKEIDKNNINCETTPEATIENNIPPITEAVIQPVVEVIAHDGISSMLNEIQVATTEEAEEDIDPEKKIDYRPEEESSSEQSLQKELASEIPQEATLEQTNEASNDVLSSQQKEPSTNDMSFVETVEGILEENSNPEQPASDQTKQEYFENENPPATETNYEESCKDPLEQNINELAQQYEENTYSTAYDQYNQPIYDADNHSFQQFDEDGQPIQHYEDQNQYIQSYDESGQPINQYDPNSQSLQQYDEHAQPTDSFVPQGELMQQYEQGQLMQQYDEHGQYLQQYDENAQYDEQGQLIPQYDEQGQLIQQYGDNEQLMQQYDGQYIGGQPQYDENGQLIQNYDYSQDQPLYDENGQIVQQNFDEQQCYTQQQEEVIDDQYEHNSENPAVPQEIGNSGGDANPLKKQEGVKEENQEQKKSSNVMDMLDTDSESVKQDTKVSHDSDFDFSNE